MSIVKTVSDTLVKHAPELLTAGTLIGIGGIAYLSGRDTLKAQKVLEAKKPETLKEKVKAVAPCYVPTAAAIIFTATCALGSYRTQHLRLLGREAALLLATQEKDALIKKVKEAGQEELYEAAKDELLGAKRENEKDIPPEVEGFGNTLMYDPVREKWFRCNIEELRATENDFNFALLNSPIGWKSLNSLYDAMGWDPMPPEIGNELGWHNRNQVHFVHRVEKTEDEIPYFVWDYTAGLCPQFYEYTYFEED